jgi:ATP-dependent protease HslVU (ClpYQ) peptidase subunit
MISPKRVTELNIEYKGPYSEELFRISHKPKDYQHIVVGSGESHAVAAIRALSQLRNLELGTVCQDIKEKVQQFLPANANAIATPQADINIYCVLSFDVEEL